MLAYTANSQTIISGTITDETNAPLPFGIVFIQQTNLGTIVDMDGHYSLEIPKEQCKDSVILRVSSLGFDSAFTIIKYFPSTLTLNFTLKTRFQMLDEVTVTAYEENMNYSISTVSGAVAYDMAAISNRGNKKGKKNGSYSALYESESTDESYTGTDENKFKSAKDNPLTTLSIDVDNASYSNVRRFINNCQTPPADAVRVEEMINYFDYDYPQPSDEHPFTVYTELSACPWNTEHKLLHVGIQGESIATENLPKSNLVFLIDVSGSMDVANKLPLVKSSLKLLINNLREEDRVAIVVYAGSAGEVLKSTPGSHKERIMDAIEQLQAGGSTAGGAGIQLAYKIAEENFIKNGNNRVILCTDGDFNVGISSENELEKLIEEKRGLGIFLTCLGYGMGNYKDSKLEILADKGNGNYGYIDNLQEANKMLVTEFGGTLFTIAKDVKIQIEFNPSKVVAYRLIGYENRLLADEDFEDDSKDAGEIGSGQTVTTLYEIIPVGVEDKFTKDLPKLKYQKNELSTEASANEIATIKFRYKLPDGNKSTEMVHPITDTELLLDNTTESFRFSAAVALFGMLLQESEFVGDGDYKMVIELAQDAKANDDDGYKAEFVRLAQVVKN